MKKLAAALLLALPLAGAAFAGPKVSFGILMPQESTTWEDLVATWKEAERLGFESAWLFDHFIPPSGDKDGSVFEGWTTLAALATQTEKIRIGILVTGNTYRNPAILAKMATTVDHVSGGRLEFGIGAAWEEHEHRAYGIPFYTARERAKRLGEALEVITRLWTEEKPSFRGQYYTLHEAEFEPKPVQKPHPPIVVGGQGKKWIMPLVGRYADEWNVGPRLARRRTRAPEDRPAGPRASGTLGPSRARVGGLPPRQHHERAAGGPGGRQAGRRRDPRRVGLEHPGADR